MLFPMIQIANNNRQSTCLIFDKTFYLYRTYKKHWRILHTIGLMITELSHLKKKRSKRGRDSDPSNVHRRGNCIPKQPRKFFCQDLSRCLTVKTQHSAPCSYQGCALKNVNYPAYPRPHTEGLWIHLTCILLDLYHSVVSIIVLMAYPSTKLPFSRDIVGKAELRCYAYCKTVGQMTVWFHFRQCWGYDFTKTLPMWIM